MAITIIYNLLGPIILPASNTPRRLGLALFFFLLFFGSFKTVLRARKVLITIFSVPLSLSVFLICKLRGWHICAGIIWYRVIFPLNQQSTDCPTMELEADSTGWKCRRNMRRTVIFTNCKGESYTIMFIFITLHCFRLYTAIIATINNSSFEVICCDICYWLC